MEGVAIALRCHKPAHNELQVGLRDLGGIKSLLRLAFFSSQVLVPSLSSLLSCRNSRPSWSGDAPRSFIFDRLGTRGWGVLNLNVGVWLSRLCRLTRCCIR